MKIGIIGAGGRMGKSLIEVVQASEVCKLSGGIVKERSEFVGIDLGNIASLGSIGINASFNIEHLCTNSDVVIDFTSPKTSLECAKICSKTNTAHIIGTTGFSEEEKEQLITYSKKTPILWSSNMSIGVNLLFALTKQVASILDDDYDIEILEMHHCRKVDAPSGTSLSLGEAAADGRSVDLGEVARKSRDGIIGARKIGEIGFSTLRGGDVVGEHSVIFAGDGERIELTHKASNRKIFAKGALKAAIWIYGRENGFYAMQDVI